MGLKPRCLLTFLALAACQTRVAFNDVDQDTFVETTPDDIANNDCDPDNAAINPDAEEVWDGVDNDCDNQIDESFDMDRDGVPATPWGLDCDDSNDLISPNATEVCGDGIDNDCDGVAGEPWPSSVALSASGIDSWQSDDPCARPACLWEDSTDRLGAGIGATVTAGAGRLVLILSAPDSPEAPVRLLIAPNDTTGTPDPEGTDTGDADGDSGEPAMEPLDELSALDTAELSAGADWDLGERVATGADLNGKAGDDPGEPDLVLSAYTHAPPWVLLCPGPLDTADRCRGLTAFEVGVEDAPALGGELALLRDRLGDGLADLLVGAPREGDDGGDVWLIAGSPSLVSTGGALEDGQIPDDLSAQRLDGEDLGLRLRGDGVATFGAALAAVEDPDGTRWSGVLIGAPDAEGCDDIAGSSDDSGGAAWLLERSDLNDAADGVVDGKDGTLGVGEVTLADVPGICFRGSDGEALGTSLAGGDLDGDGYPDLAIGAPLADRGALRDSGAVYLFTNWSWRIAEVDEAGRAVVSTDTATVRLEGSLSGQQAGASVAMVGDLDGDGLGDLMIGGEPEDADGGVGVAWLVPGREADQWDPWVDLDAETGVTRFTSDQSSVVALSPVPAGGTLLGGALLGVPDMDSSSGAACLLPARGP